MKTTNNKIDEMIKQALHEEDRETFDSLGEQNLFQMVGGLFSGKLKWLMILINVVMVAFFIGFIYCLVKFLKADDIKMMITYGAGAFTAIIAVTMLKLFAWMQIDKNAILREIKRLELQVSLLSNKF